MGGEVDTKGGSGELGTEVVVAVEADMYDGGVAQGSTRPTLELLTEDGTDLLRISPSRA